MTQQDPNVAREQGYLAEARDIGDAELVAHLQGRVTALEATAKQADAAAAELAEAELAYTQARHAFGAADVAYAAGTLDAKKAMQLFADREVASAKVRALTPPAAAAKAKLATLRARLEKRDTDRESAQSTTSRIATAVMRGNASNLDLSREATASPTVRLWWGLFEHRELRDYAASTQAMRTSSTQTFPPVRDLEAVFANRRQIVEAHQARLRAELERLQSATTRAVAGRQLAQL